MLLAVDIGNTNISFGLFNGRRLEEQFDIPTKNASINDIIRARIKKPGDITASVICSVVPAKTRALLKTITALTGKKPYIIGKGTVVPIKNLYLRPKQLGQDRLVNAYAASVLYGKPLIVIDSGTATTIDVVDKKNRYMGGVICAGMRIALEALNEKTAALPRIRLGAPESLIARDTKNGMLSGAVFGSADSCGGIVGRIKKLLGEDTSLVGTGGAIFLLKKYSGMNLKIDKNLTLKGLSLVYQNEIAKHI